jgi:hypothetical protein
VPENVADHVSISLPPHHIVKLVDAMRLLGSLVGHLAGVLATGEPQFPEVQVLTHWAALGLFSGGWYTSVAADSAKRRQGALSVTFSPRNPRDGQKLRLLG